MGYGIVWIITREYEFVDAFETEEEALKTIEKCILFFKENGIAGERFSDTINRIGFENVQKELLSDEILKRKEVSA